jgi:3-oxoacyl-[acyl-carrier protein] reductase
MSDAPEREVVLITGSRVGIGQYLARHYVERGAQVIGCSRQPVEQELDGYTHFCLDVADESAVQDMFTAVNEKFGRLDILINNAGVGSMNHILLTPLATVRKVMEVNYLGTFLCSREAAKLMRRRKYGRIVNMSSIGVSIHLEGEASYVASKSAVEELTRVMARELAPFNITCNLVGPSPLETDLTRGVPAEKMEAMVQRLAIKRMSTFADIANVVEFFAKPESDYVTGQIIYLGGP